MSVSPFRFGTVGSPNSTPKKPGGSVGGVYRLAELELDSLELGWVQSVRVSESTCAAIKEAALENGVAISVHAPYYINLNATEEEWPKSRKRLMDAAYFGYLAGATDIVFHSGSYFTRPSSEVLPVAIPRLRGCVEELRAAGNPVLLRPETMGEPALLGSLEDILEMSLSIEGVQPCIDFAHLHARGGDGSLNSYAEWVQVLETCQQALGEQSLKNLHVHLSGIEYGLRGEKKHLPLKESDLDLAAILRALKDYQCAGRLLCESPVLEDDALFIKQTWLELDSAV